MHRLYQGSKRLNSSTAVEETKIHFQTSSIYPYGFSMYPILDVHVTKENKLILITTKNNCPCIYIINQTFETSEKNIQVRQDRVTDNIPARKRRRGLEIIDIVNESNAENSLKIKSFLHNDNLLLLVKKKNNNKHFAYRLFIFDSNLNQLSEKNISNANDIVSVAANNSKYYCLLKSTSNNNFVSIYDDELNEVAKKGLDAKHETDPFYFSTKVTQLRVSNQSIFILDPIFIKEMNKETGIIMMQLEVYDLTFEIIKNGFVLYSGFGQVYVYGKSERKKKSIALPDELKLCISSFLSDQSVIGFNMTSNKIIVSKF